MELEDQVALVTGAGRGIGRACAETLAAAGARVIAVARTAADLAALEKHASGRITGWAADVRDAAFYARVERLDRLDILVNNAGTNRPGPLLEVSEESLDVMLDLNVRAVFRAAQSAARVMLNAGNGGCIINMSSQMGHVGSPDRSVYCMTKHAVEGLTKALAVELASQRVRVNAVAPTFVRTPLTEPMLADPAFSSFVLDMIPLGEVATVDDIAAAVLFLASSGARMVTGHSLVVDGGWTAR
jgi:NAD(P)-dependent dehydrogenase (short-subunit alcohol dehydrogenase family)